MIIELSKNQRRNRDQRRKTTLYRLCALAREERPLRAVEGDGETKPLKLVAGEDCAIEGELEGYILVSVPPTISHQAAKVLQDKLRETLGKPVMLFTHNVLFLRAEKMSSKEANEVLKEVEDGVAAQAAAAKQRTRIAAATAAPAAPEASPEAPPAEAPEAAPGAPEAAAPVQKDPQ